MIAFYICIYEGNFKKAEAILDKADDFSTFASEYDQNLRMHGERLVDGAIFVFDLGKNYSLVVNFSDYSFDNFSLIHESADSFLLNHI
jgi:hypothetical protein